MIVAVCAGGHIGIALPDEGCTMHAVFIEVEDLLVAACAGLWDTAFGYIRQGDVMRAMAVTAHRSLLIWIDLAVSSFGMSVIGLAGDDICMATAAGRLHLEGYIAPVLCSQSRVWVTSDICMAIYALVSLLAMD